MSRNLLISLVTSLVASQVLGQQPAPSGTIKEAEFIIEKEKQNRLPESPRLFEKAPLPTSVPDNTVGLQYELWEIVPEFNTLAHKIKVLRAKQDLLARLYGNYVRGGYGNYHTPYVEVFFDNKRDAGHAYGLHLRHLSRGKNRYAEELHNAARLHGKLFTTHWLLDGAIWYSGDQYPLAKLNNGPDKAQAFRQIHLHSGLANYHPSQFNYQVHGQFNHLSNTQEAHEHQGGVGGAMAYTVHDGFVLQAITDLYLSQHQDVVAINRHLGRLKPTLTFWLNDWKVQAGFNLVYQNDTAGVVNQLNAYPVLELNYTLRRWFRPYIRIGGDMQQNFWQSFVAENPWLAPKADLRHTNQSLVLCGGAQGDVTAKLAFHAGFSIGSYQNFYCFVNNAAEPRQFDIQYDPATTMLNVFGELTQTNRAETLITRLRGGYCYYKLKQLPKPWHRPHYRLDLLSTYSLYDKILFKGTVYWLGGLEAWDLNTQTAQSLADVIDLGIGMDYLWSQRLSVFLDCQNLLARANARYLQGPTRGFQFILGLAYAW